jgi:hypothetical protein
MNEPVDNDGPKRLRRSLVLGQRPYKDEKALMEGGCTCGRVPKDMLDIPFRLLKANVVCRWRQAFCQAVPRPRPRESREQMEKLMPFRANAVPKHPVIVGYAAGRIKPWKFS